MISVHAVIPMFCMLLIGVLVKRFKVLGEEELPRINNLVFSVFLPLLVFSGIYKSDLSDAIDAGLILFTLAALMLVFFGGLLFTLLIEKNNASRGAIIQAIFRANIAIMGCP
jgi:predicted permease